MRGSSYPSRFRGLQACLLKASVGYICMPLSWSPTPLFWLRPSGEIVFSFSIRKDSLIFLWWMLFCFKISIPKIFRLFSLWPCPLKWFAIGSSFPLLILEIWFANLWYSIVPVSPTYTTLLHCSHKMPHITFLVLQSILSRNTIFFGFLNFVAVCFMHVFAYRTWFTTFLCPWLPCFFKHFSVFSMHQDVL